MKRPLEIQESKTLSSQAGVFWKHWGWHAEMGLVPRPGIPSPSYSGGGSDAVPVPGGPHASCSWGCCWMQDKSGGLPAVWESHQPSAYLYPSGPVLPVLGAAFLHRQGAARPQSVQGAPLPPQGTHGLKGRKCPGPQEGGSRLRWAGS